MGHKTTKSRYSVFIQCVVTKKNRTLVTWLHEKFAVLDKVLDLYINGKWDEYWVVTELGTVDTDGRVMKGAMDYKAHRKSTDI